MQEQINLQRLQFLHEFQKVFETAANAVNTPGGDHIHLVTGGGFHERIKPRPLVPTLGPGDALVPKHMDDLPIPASSDFALAVPC